MSAAGGAGPGVLLLGCPFCGVQPRSAFCGSINPDKTEIACENDDCDVNPSVTGFTADSAREKWNRRAAAPGPDRGEAERQGLDAVLRGDLGMWHGDRVTIGAREYWDAALKDQRRAIVTAERRAAAAEARAERAERERDTSRDEIADLTARLADAEGELSQAGGYIGNLEAEADRLQAEAAQLGGPAREGCRSTAELQERSETAGGAGAADPAAAGRADTSLRCPAGYVQDGDACAVCGATEDGWCKRDPSDPRNARALTEQEQP